MGPQSDYLSEDDILAFERDGAVLVKGVFSDWIETICSGVERNMREPGPYASQNVAGTDTGVFFDDYCNWRRIPEFADVVLNSPAGEIAATVTRSAAAQFFHDHVLVKEPGTSKETPWHQDMPYYFVSGSQTVSFWIPVDPVTDSTLRFIAGSHKWEKFLLPIRWLDDDSFYPGANDYLPVPNPDAEPGKYNVLEWEMEPGDAALFSYRTAHGARANMNDTRRRAFSMRWLGDDTRYCERPGTTSPPYPGHGMVEGQKLRQDWFPTVFRG